MRNAISKPMMRSANIEVVEAVLVQHRLKVALTKNDHVVQALTTNTAEKSFDYRIHQRRSDGGLNDLDPGALGNAIEVRPKLVIAIANKKLRSCSEGCRFTKLLRGPLLRRVTSHGYVNHSFGIDVNDEEREDRPKADVVDP